MRKSRRTKIEGLEFDLNCKTETVGPKSGLNQGELKVCGPKSDMSCPTVSRAKVTKNGQARDLTPSGSKDHKLIYVCGNCLFEDLKRPSQKSQLN